MKKNLIPSDNLITFITSKKCDRECAFASLSIDNSTLIHAEQVHGSEIAIVTGEEKDPIAGVDALITTTPGIFLGVRTADCLPILIYHKNPYLIAAIHSGRAGTELNILEKTLELLKRNYGITKDAMVWLGPAICNNCYQIDREQDLHYDLITKNKVYLKESGLRYTLYEDGRCTSCNSNELYSWRKNKDTERIYSVIGTTK